MFGFKAPFSAETSMKIHPATQLAVLSAIFHLASAAETKSVVRPEQPAGLFSLNEVRLLDGPFAAAAKANREYLLAHSADRLLAPCFREADLKPKAEPYGN